MKNIAKKMYILVALLAAVAIQVHVVLKAAKEQEKKVSFPKTLVESVRTETDHLSVIAANAFTLVEHMQKNVRNETERKQALKKIDIALKKLPEDAQKEIEPSLEIIKKESQTFSSHRKPLQKFNSATAEDALKSLTQAIKRVANNNAEKIVTESQQLLLATVNKAETLEKEAHIAINKAREDLAQGLITPIEAAKIIGEQNYLVDSAKRALKKQTQEAQENVTNSDIQTSYLTQFATNMYAFGSQALAPFKAGYGYTQEEKEIARAIIAELEAQLAAITKEYQDRLIFTQRPDERADLQKSFETSIKDIYNAIHQQKLITGDVMSTNRKLFWGTVAVAGTLLAGYLGHQYFATSPETMPAVTPEITTTTATPVAEQQKKTTEQAPVTAVITPNKTESTEQQEQQTLTETTETEISKTSTPPSDDSTNPPSAGPGNEEGESASEAQELSKQQTSDKTESATQPSTNQENVDLKSETNAVHVTQEAPKPDPAKQVGEQSSVQEQPEGKEDQQPFTPVTEPGEEAPLTVVTGTPEQKETTIKEQSEETQGSTEEQQQNIQKEKITVPSTTIETETPVTPEKQIEKLNAAIREIEQNEAKGIQPSEQEIEGLKNLIKETQETTGQLASNKTPNLENPTPQEGIEETNEDNSGGSEIEQTSFAAPGAVAALGALGATAAYVASQESTPGNPTDNNGNPLDPATTGQQLQEENPEGDNPVEDNPTGESHGE